jgi:hypothetical protein
LFLLFRKFTEFKKRNQIYCEKLPVPLLIRLSGRWLDEAFVTDFAGFAAKSAPKATGVRGRYTKGFTRGYFCLTTSGSVDGQLQVILIPRL